MQRRNYSTSCEYADRAFQVLDENADAGNGTTV
jgi:hypothetical protein